MEELKIPHYVKHILSRLERDSVLICQASQAEEAILKGNGRIYYTHPDGKPVGGASARYCIEHGLVKPAGDDLFPGGSQTYRLA